MEAKTNEERPDIQYLLHLEALKRYYEETKDLQRQVEEQTRIYLEAKQEYNDELRRMVELRKQMLLNDAVDAPTPTELIVDSSKVKAAMESLKKLTEKMQSDKQPADMDPRMLAEFKKELALRHKARTQLARQQGNFAENLDTFNTVTTSLDTMEGIFEATTQLTIELFSDGVRPPILDNP